jgi:DNA-directed RNA polymerase specialized sigma24 family protein
MTSLRAVTCFAELRDLVPLFARFDSGAASLNYFRGQGDLDDKDRLYGALVRVAQGRGHLAPLAYTLLWCGLWPGLDRVYRCHLRGFATDPEELTEAISVAFTRLVGRLDLSRVHRVAATLVRSTHREITDERKRDAREVARTVGGSDAMAALLAGANQEAAKSPMPLSFVGELADLRTRLATVVGADADLALAVLVLGYGQGEVATQLGLSHAAARKRLQRALPRIRDYLRSETQLATPSPAIAPKRTLPTR